MNINGGPSGSLCLRSILVIWITKYIVLAHRYVQTLYTSQNLVRYFVVLVFTSKVALVEAPSTFYASLLTSTTSLLTQPIYRNSVTTTNLAHKLIITAR
jgi:hypothetical protein